jgi:hypothetical protein
MSPTKRTRAYLLDDDDIWDQRIAVAGLSTQQAGYSALARQVMLHRRGFNICLSKTSECLWFLLLSVMLYNFKTYLETSIHYQDSLLFSE